MVFKVYGRPGQKFKFQTFLFATKGKTDLMFNKISYFLDYYH